MKEGRVVHRPANGRAGGGGVDLLVEGPIHGIASLFPRCSAAANGQTLRAVAAHAQVR
jgi:hypothetical protein